MLALLRQLPPDSPLGIAINGEAARWGIDTHLLATAVDVLVAANFQRGGGKGPRPKPIPRPDPGEEKKRREYLARLRRRGLIKDGG